MRAYTAGSELSLMRDFGWRIYIWRVPPRSWISHAVFFTELPCVIHPDWSSMETIIAQQLPWEEISQEELLVVHVEAALLGEFIA